MQTSIQAVLAGSKARAFFSPVGDSRRARLAGVGLIVLLNAGCAIGRIESIERMPASTKCDALTNVCGVPWRQTAEFQIWGTGICTAGTVNFGDGSAPTTIGPFDFGQAGALNPLKITHTYTNWPGPKTITAEGVTNCVGKPSIRVHALDTTAPLGHQEEVVFGFGAGRVRFCDSTTTILNHPWPAMRKNTQVMVMKDPNPNVRIDFGCPFGACVFDADGKPNSQASGNFPFHGLREYSLVFRIVAANGQTQIEQGGTNASFTVKETGPLEICVNDDKVGDNKGAWRIIFKIDESNAP